MGQSPNNKQLIRKEPYVPTNSSSISSTSGISRPKRYPHAVQKLSPQPAPEGPMTPRDARRARREAQRDELVTNTINLILDESRVSSPPARAGIAHAILQQGYRPGEVAEIREAIERVLQSRPDLIDPRPVVKVDEETYAQLARNRMNSVDPDEYRERMQNAGLPVPLFRKVEPPPPPGTRVTPPAAEVEPHDPETARYVEMRHNAGLPPLSRNQLLSFRGPR